MDTHFCRFTYQDNHKSRAMSKIWVLAIDSITLLGTGFVAYLVFAVIMQFFFSTTVL